MTKNIMIVGVGGQGSLLASKLLGHLLLSEGYDVKVSEVHGMSQRGGSVVTYVRFGEKVYSPIIDKGEADVIVSFEKLEAARYVEFLREGGFLSCGFDRKNAGAWNTGRCNGLPFTCRKSRFFESCQYCINGSSVQIF